MIWWKICVIFFYFISYFMCLGIPCSKCICSMWSYVRFELAHIRRRHCWGGESKHRVTFDVLPRLMCSKYKCKRTFDVLKIWNSVNASDPSIMKSILILPLLLQKRCMVLFCPVQTESHCVTEPGWSFFLTRMIYLGCIARTYYEKAAYLIYTIL